MEHDVDVVTVFTASPPDTLECTLWDELTGATSSRERVLERRREDISALAHFRIVPIHLEILEPQYRNQPCSIDDLLPLVSIVSQYKEVWLPAGIGLHPDHVLTRQACLSCQSDQIVRLYADLPYAVRFGWPGWLTGATPTEFVDVDRWYDAQFRSTKLDQVRVISTRSLDDREQDLKRRAMAEYATQIPALMEGYNRRLRDSAVLRHELFWTLDA